jgi:hypothetical protein
MGTVQTESAGHMMIGTASVRISGTVTSNFLGERVLVTLIIEKDSNTLCAIFAHSSLFSQKVRHFGAALTPL